MNKPDVGGGPTLATGGVAEAARLGWAGIPPGPPSLFRTLADRIVEMRRQGADYAEIAAALNCTIGRVRRISSRMGVAVNPRLITGETIKRIIDLYGAGVPQRTIAKMTGVSRDTVMKVRRDAGLPPPRPQRRNEASDDAIRAARADSKTVMEFAQKLGISRKSVHYHINRLDLEKFPAGVSAKAERNAAIAKAFAAGSSAELVAREFGVSRNTVIGVIWRAGIYRPVARKVRRQAPIKKRPAIIRPPKFARASYVRPADPVEALRLPLVEMTAEQCCFPVTADHPFLFCGNPKTEASSYCAHHHARCHTAARGSSQPRPRDWRIRR